MGCPKKRPASKKNNRCLRALSRKKRKLQTLLNKLKDNPNSPKAQIEAVKRKLYLAHTNIRDAINRNLLYREQQAVNKVKENPKYFYSYAKQFSKKKSNISMLFDKNKNIHANPQEIANLLQRQFTSVFSDPSKTDLNSASFSPPVCAQPFTDDMLDFSISDIIDAINEIKPNAAPGPDELPVTLLKNCSEALAPAIHLIWSHSFETGVVPNFYKLSHIAPLHKKDSRAVPENYRPISLTSKYLRESLGKRWLNILFQMTLFAVHSMDSKQVAAASLNYSIILMI